MKNNLKIIPVLIVTIMRTAWNNSKNEQEMNSDKTKLYEIFPKGSKGPSENFTGNAYNIGLVDPGSVLTTVVGNVYFEPGARSNWHSHPAGQILIITDGVGYHQIEGQPIEIIKKVA